MYNLKINENILKLYNYSQYYVSVEKFFYKNKDIKLYALDYILA